MCAAFCVLGDAGVVVFSYYRDDARVRWKRREGRGPYVVLGMSARLILHTHGICRLPGGRGTQRVLPAPSPRSHTLILFCCVLSSCRFPLAPLTISARCIGCVVHSSFSLHALLLLFSFKVYISMHAYICMYACACVCVCHLEAGVI